MRDPTSFLGAEYRQLVDAQLDWRLRVLQGPSAPWCEIDGKRVLMLCSNNYLGFSNHPKLKEAARRAIDTHGVGSGSVRPIAGTMDLHVELERRLAEMEAMYDKVAADLIEALDVASAYRATASTMHQEIERRNGIERRKKIEASFLVTGQRKNVEDRRKSWPR